jgi:hypothetical protein
MIIWSIAVHVNEKRKQARDNGAGANALAET